MDIVGLTSIKPHSIPIQQYNHTHHIIPSNNFMMFIFQNIIIYLPVYWLLIQYNGANVNKINDYLILKTKKTYNDINNHLIDLIVSFIYYIIV